MNCRSLGHLNVYFPQLFPRLSALQRASTEAERVVPGVTLELVNEIVDSVEQVEDEQ